MNACIHYGQQAVIHLDLPPEAIVLDRPGPAGEPLDDPAAAVAAALCEPLDFPALDAATTPDDRVAITVGPGVPQAAAVVAGVVHALCDAGVSLENVAIVRSAAEPQRDLISALQEDQRRAVQVVTHSPGNRGKLSYLAASDDGQPIYFNRVVFDADVVIPVGCLRSPGVLGHTGVNVGLYPAFADTDAQRRFNLPQSAEEPAGLQQRQHEADEAAWLLGVMLTVQIIPGRGGTVLHVLAGERRTVAQQGSALCQQAWSFPLPERADLVIATLEGGREQQTWENFARALFAASRAVTEDGAIAICSELTQPPGPALQKLIGELTSEEAIRQIRRDETSDALTASALWHVLETNRVYLLSRLDPDVVESMGMAHVSDGEEIARLSSRHHRCILLGSAQHAVPHD